MAALECKKCKKEVSKSDKKCPYCGVDNPTLSTSDAIWGVIIIAVIAFTFVQCSSDEEITENSTQEERVESIESGTTSESIEEEKQESVEAEKATPKDQETKVKEEEDKKAKEEEKVREEAEKKARKEQEAKEKEEAQNQKDLGVTYQKLVSRIKGNEVNSSVKLTPKISSENTTPTGLKIKNVRLKGENMAMLVESKENGKLTSIVSMASGDGSASSGSDILLGLVVIIQAVDGSLTTKQAGSLIAKKLKLTELKKDGDTHKAVNNGIKYSLSIGSMTGVMLVISPE